MERERESERISYMYNVSYDSLTLITTFGLKPLVFLL
jgi:hypothetical protein